MGLGDYLYLSGTLIQFIAFAIGMRPTTLGIALTCYGIGVFFYASRWVLK